MAVVGELPSEVSGVRWFHSFDLNGIEVSGIKPLGILKAEADLIFRKSIADKNVLDIGAWDGFFSFEAERRGAGRVLATDHFCWSGPGWGSKDGFNCMHRLLNSNIESLDIDVTALDPSELGTFDVVLFLGVLYHVKDPYACLEAAARMCSDHLVIETVTALPHESLPAMRLYRPGELGDDPTNFWAPNVPALQTMLSSFGFSKVEALPSPVSTDHPLLKKPGRYGRKKINPNGNYRTIVHAWRD
jgi:tRNA (mo5U34)-methyltransferase